MEPDELFRMPRILESETHAASLAPCGRLAVLVPVVLLYTCTLELTQSGTAFRKLHVFGRSAPHKRFSHKALGSASSELGAADSKRLPAACPRGLREDVESSGPSHRSRILLCYHVPLSKDGCKNRGWRPGITGEVWPLGMVGSKRGRVQQVGGRALPTSATLVSGN